MPALSWLSIYAPLPPSVYLRRPRRLPFPLDRPGCQVFAQARQGLFHALSAVGLRQGDEVLAPAYHHGCEIETLVRAGLRCRFYDVADTVHPREAELDRLVGPSTRALHLIHYLGFPQDSPSWRRWCDERGLLLIEDGAQAWMSANGPDPVGAQGDIAIFCLYKTVGVPDGGAVICNAPVGPPAGGRELGLRRLAHRHVDWLAQRWHNAARRRADLEHAHEIEERPETHFALLRADQPALVATRALLTRVADPTVPERRRANFSRLAERLGRLQSPAFPSLGPSASPLAFPIEVERKRTVVARLAQAGVIDGKLWCVPHPSLEVAHYPRATELRERLVGLPLHQELRHRDLERVVNAVRHAVAT